MNAWDVWDCDLGHGPHPVVIVSHPLRVKNEVLLDTADGMNWPTLCKCDCIYAVEKSELKNHRGQVTIERRRAIVRTIIDSHAWNKI